MSLTSMVSVSCIQVVPHLGNVTSQMSSSRSSRFLIWSSISRKGRGKISCCSGNLWFEIFYQGLMVNWRRRGDGQLVYFVYCPFVDNMFLVPMSSPIVTSSFTILMFLLLTLSCLDYVLDYSHDLSKVIVVIKES